AEKQLDAEEKRFFVGLSTNFQVLEFQDDLATAQSNETRAITDEIRALVTYQRVTGQTLSRHQIGLKDFLP
ncbi:MAG: TolC family protein, partial [bacterium]